MSTKITRSTKTGNKVVVEKTTSGAVKAKPVRKPVNKVAAVSKKEAAIQSKSKIAKNPAVQKTVPKTPVKSITSSESMKKTTSKIVPKTRSTSTQTNTTSKVPPMIQKDSALKKSDKESKNSVGSVDVSVLTEKQLLKMSDAEYMNATQLNFFKERLRQLEKDLLKNAGETTEHLRETVLVPDPADRATIEEEHAIELRTRDRERKLLKKIQQSIQSIDSGDYGWCEETGDPIGIPRLLARPTATLSLEAQQRRELKQKLYGD